LRSRAWAAKLTGVHGFGIASRWCAYAAVALVIAYGCAAGVGAVETPRGAVAPGTSPPAAEAAVTAAPRIAHDVPPGASPGCSGASAPAVRGERRQITVAGEERSYLLDAPASESAAPRPVVFAFHGFRGDAAGLRLGTGLATLAERERVILVTPEGHEGVQLLGTVGRGWDLGADETRDVAVVRALLDTLERERCVDRRRVYATGMSNGGFFASLVGCALADRIAAIAPVAGAMPLAGCMPARPVAVVLTFGRADNLVPPTMMRAGGSWWAKTDGCGTGHDRDGCTAYEQCTADVVVCEGPQAHTWPPDTTERIWRFFVAHPGP
jgi:polyhydroxybutyrate depolymerase